MSVQLVVTYDDQTVMYYPVDNGWKISNTNRCIVINKMPRTYVPLDKVLSFEVQVSPPAKPRPTVVCLCGSTRFEQEFRRVAAELTLGGAIVVKPDLFLNDGHVEKGHLPNVTPEVKRELDELHKRKIDLADYVLVLNVNGYIGDSTRSEIEYAVAQGKLIRYLSDSAVTRKRTFRLSPPAIDTDTAVIPRVYIPTIPAGPDRHA